MEVPIPQSHNTIAVVQGTAREPSAQYPQSYSAGGFNSQIPPNVLNTTNYGPTQGTKIYLVNLASEDYNYTSK